MEAKTLLGLIKYDIEHLEGITGDFLLEPLPSADEVDLALVRAKALIRELELLHKVAAQHESNSFPVKLAKEPGMEVAVHYHLEKEPFELFASANVDHEQEPKLIQVQEDPIPVEVVQNADLNNENQHNTEESPEITTNTITDENHFSALIEPAESIDVPSESPVIGMEEVDEHITSLAETSESGDFVPVNSIINDEVVIEIQTTEAEPNETYIDTPEEPVENTEDAAVDHEDTDKQESAIADSAIVTDNQDPNQEILAEEFKEVKKTLNETLGESHQMVNDILSHEKDETGFQIIQLNSIWDGIGINDRFLFIRELFANSSAKFENTVNALDKLSTIQDAVSYLKMNFKWNKTEASHKFLVLVKRRFIK